MVKIVKYLKQSWLKNDDDKGGAMQEMIDNKKINEISILKPNKRKKKVLIRNASSAVIVLSSTFTSISFSG